MNFDFAILSIFESSDASQNDQILLFSMVGHLVVVLLLMLMMVPVRGNLVDLVAIDILVVTLVVLIKTMTAVLVTK